MWGVSVTFDVDGEAGVAVGRLSRRSEGRFGVVRGVGRVVEVLARFEVRATFYVPGVVVQAEPVMVRELVAAGHEVAHHGHEHRVSVELDAAGQRAEIERGIAAIEDCLGARPAGYRSPGWELTSCTLALLGEHGFAYDSSLMGDDRPYRIHAGERELVELPVHWSLDDVPYLAWTAQHGPLRHWRDALACWIAEADAARHDQRHLTYTLHPDICGRAHRLPLLERLLDHLHNHHTPLTTHTHTASQHG